MGGVGANSVLCKSLGPYCTSVMALGTGLMRVRASEITFASGHLCVSYCDGITIQMELQNFNELVAKLEPLDSV